MKIRLDAELCTGHGRCYSVAPNLFSCDDEGFGQVIDSLVAPEHEDEARRAVGNCPENAVIIEL